MRFIDPDSGNNSTHESQFRINDIHDPRFLDLWETKSWGYTVSSPMQAFSSLVSDIAKILDKEGPTERSTGTLRLGEGNSYSQAHQKSHCPCT